MSERKLTRRSVLAGATAAGVVGSIGGGTVALLQDRVEFPGNKASVGSMDLTLNDSSKTIDIRYGDIEPGDSGKTVIHLSVCENPGWVWLRTSRATSPLAEVLLTRLLVDDTLLYPWQSLTELTTDPPLANGQRLEERVDCDPATDLEFQWRLPQEDQIETAIEDKEGPEASFSIEFAAQQWRHNPKPDNPWGSQ
jgi:hypothetical protein